MIAHALLLVLGQSAVSQSAVSQLPANQLPASQVPSTTRDSTYSSAALAKMIEMASQANRRVPPELLGYSALIESEASLLVNTPGGPDGAVAGTAAATTEAAAQIEQFVLRSSWDRAGTFEQQQVGYRSRLLGPSISALNILPKPWTAPALYGNRLSLLFGGAPSLMSADTTRRNMPAVHPFADDRAQFYRFSGGDTVATIKLGPGNQIPLVRIVVEPIVERQTRLMMFAGDVYIDGNTGSIIRLRGRIRVGPVKQSPASRLVRFVAQVQEVGYIDFENSLQKGKYWLPSKQRLEYQAITSFTEARATIRVQSVWRDMELKIRDSSLAVASIDSLGEPHYTVKLTGGDSISNWGSWGNSLGALTADGSARDFDDVAPPEFRPNGRAQFRLQARGFGDVVRFNRVEGLFVGGAGLIDFRESAPGASIRLFGGYATLPKTAKGGAEGALVKGPWVANARAERQLASTNDFALALGGGGGNIIGSLFGVENYDWVDRRVLSAGLTREFGIKHSSALRVELARGNDRGFGKELKHGMVGDDFRANRPVTGGSYTRTRAQFDIGRNIITSPLASGLGASAIYELGTGDLDWQRSLVQTFGQRMFHRFIFAARADGSVLNGKQLPVQQLIEVGGAEGLPGYEYKEFAGDQALVARGTVGYLLPLLEQPIRFNRLTLPAIGPQIQVGLFGGVTSASSTTRAQLNQLQWKTTDGWRGTFDVRLRFFGGAFSIGASRPLDHSGPWKAAFAIGGAL
ncbi:MAG: hypothetical protein ABJB74_02225 [Gemmatimonas sp.]